MYLEFADDLVDGDVDIADFITLVGVASYVGDAGYNRIVVSVEPAGQPGKRIILGIFGLFTFLYFCVIALR